MVCGGNMQHPYIRKPLKYHVVILDFNILVEFNA